MRRIIVALTLLTAPLARAAAPASVYDVTVTKLGGGDESLATFKGQVLLVVNTATGCGYAPQLGDLEKLYQRLKGKGFAVLGFPSDDFHQESLDGEAMASYCKLHYGVTFPMFRRSHVNGPQRSALYRFLIQAAPGGKDDVQWNYEKFLIDRHGKVLARYPTKEAPTDPRLVADVEAALAAKP